MRVVHTLQQFFNLLVRESAAGRFPSKNSARNICVYRGKNGRKCPAGHLIPDEEYDGRFEGRIVIDEETLAEHVETHPHNFFKDEWLPDGLSRSDLRRIQEVHDSMSSWDAWDHRSFVVLLAYQPVFKSMRHPPIRNVIRAGVIPLGENPSGS